ncbi:MAG: polar amino acid transport system substrate-binding protein [Verrucomicrobiota bacterium]|jgi:cyclohexadienyl dehydratase
MSENEKNNNLPSIALIAAIVAIIVATAALLRHSILIGNNSETTTTSGLLDRIEKTGELHAGYGVYPPYTQEDPNTRKLSGFSVDLIEQIGKELKCKVIWHRLNWNTMSADLKRGEYDVIADPIFQTIPRAREFSFTEPYAFFADGIGVVRKDDNRFATFDSLNQNEITIAVGQGWASETLVKSRFTRPKVVSVQTTTDLLQVFNEVASGRADVAVADGADAERFVKEHPDTVKALWLNDPPAAMPAGFALRPTDEQGAQFLNVCLRNLQSTGVLDALERKYQIQSFKKAR